MSSTGCVRRYTFFFFLVVALLLFFSTDLYDTPFRCMFFARAFPATLRLGHTGEKQGRAYAYRCFFRNGAGDSESNTNLSGTSRHQPPQQQQQKQQKLNDSRNDDNDN